MQIPQILYFVLAGVLIIAGLIGSVLPVLPGVPLVFVGMVLAAWADGFAHVGTFTLILLGALCILAMLVDFVAGLLGARRVGASKYALWGAMCGTLVGIFFGLPGLLSDRFWARSPANSAPAAGWITPPKLASAPGWACCSARWRKSPCASPCSACLRWPL